MKATDKKKPIKTTPKGVWESNRPQKEEDNNRGKSSPSTDLQGNGYPISKNK